MAGGTLRIAMIGHEFTRTGAAFAFYRLARHWQTQGHHVTVFRSGTADGPIRDLYAADGFTIESQLDVRRFDLVVGNTICAAPIIERAATYAPAIWWIHESEVGTGLVMQHPAWLAAFQKADATVFCTPAQRDLYRTFTQGAPPGALRVISPDVAFDPAAVNPKRAAPKQRPLRVVQVGSIEQRKRPGDLVLGVQASGADYECVLIGDYFSIRPEARALIDANPERFRLIPGIDLAATLDWIASADVFCLASASETQPISVFEAALLERPLLLTDLPCYEGLFRHGRNCVMVPVGDIELMAASLAMLAANPNLRTRLGAAAQLAAQPFASDRTHGDFDRLIADVMRRRRR